MVASLFIFVPILYFSFFSATELAVWLDLGVVRVESSDVTCFGDDGTSE